jgi:hypothetical protein
MIIEVTNELNTMEVKNISGHNKEMLEALHAMAQEEVNGDGENSSVKSRLKELKNYSIAWFVTLSVIVVCIIAFATDSGVIFPTKVGGIVLLIMIPAIPLHITFFFMTVVKLIQYNRAKQKKDVA